jgi:hypothetical protein
MRLYDVPVNQSLPTEVNRGLTSYNTLQKHINKVKTAFCVMLKFLVFV